jgi:hypothetical protein
MAMTSLLASDERAANSPKYVQTAESALPCERFSNLTNSVDMTCISAADKALLDTFVFDVASFLTELISVD